MIDRKVKKLARRRLAEGVTKLSAMYEMLGGDAFALVFGQTLISKASPMPVILKLLGKEA